MKNYVITDDKIISKFLGNIKDLVKKLKNLYGGYGKFVLSEGLIAFAHAPEQIPAYSCGELILDGKKLAPVAAYFAESTFLIDCATYEEFLKLKGAPITQVVVQDGAFSIYSKDDILYHTQSTGVELEGYDKLVEILDRTTQLNTAPMQLAEGAVAELNAAAKGALFKFVMNPSQGSVEQTSYYTTDTKQPGVYSLDLARKFLDVFVVKSLKAGKVYPTVTFDIHAFPKRGAEELVLVQIDVVNENFRACQFYPIIKL